MGRIGPNAITRVEQAAREQLDAATVAELFQSAGLGGHLLTPPGQMVDEEDVVRLHRALRETLGLATARALGRRAGELTGDYLLGHRIPPAAQWVLRRLPASAASRLLLAAIGKHAWTFAGTGEFTVGRGRPLQLRIAGCPLCRGAEGDTALCDYYAATFERLYRVLVSPRTRVTERACQATGAAACVFEVRWD